MLLEESCEEWRRRLEESEHEVVRRGLIGGKRTRGGEEGSHWSWDPLRGVYRWSMATGKWIHEASLIICSHMNSWQGWLGIYEQIMGDRVVGYHVVRKFM